MNIIRTLIILLGVGQLAACAQDLRADPRDIAASRYVSEEPTSITLITMINKRNGRGAHSAILINASERVLYDPAGTFQHESLPESADIHYGMTDRMVSYYNRYHARFSHYVLTQKVEVSPATAELIMRRAQAQGATAKMHCAVSITKVLQPIVPFTDVEVTYYPENLRQKFAAIPGVENGLVDEEDQGKNVPTN